MPWARSRAPSRQTFWRLSSPRSLLGLWSRWAKKEEGAHHTFLCTCVNPLLQPIPETLELLNDVRADVLSSSTSEFWLVIRAIRDFAARAGALPVSGRLPDMTATTDLYVSLQRLFQSKSAEDVAAVVELVEAHASSCGVTLSPRFQALTEHMCKHVRSLRCIRCRPLAARLAVSAQSIECVL